MTTTAVFRSKPLSLSADLKNICDGLEAVETFRLFENSH